MPVYAWIAVWAVVVLGLAALVAREKLSGRREPEEFDTLQHSAVREAHLHRDMRGDNTLGGGSWGG